MNSNQKEGRSNVSQAVETRANGHIKAETLEEVLVKGNLESLTTDQRLQYYNRVCESTGLNPLTRPFEYIKLNNKLTLYAKKDATDQLRKIYDVSLGKPEIVANEGVLFVTIEARLPNGRTDSDIGAVDIGRQSGAALANSYKKAVTQAKRRVTLAICGLGLLDESEIGDVPSHAVQEVQVNHDTGEIVDPPALPEGIKPASEAMQDGITEKQTNMIHAVGAEIPGAPTGDDLHDALNKMSGKRFDGKRVSQLTKGQASEFIEYLMWVRDKKVADVQEAEVVEDEPVESEQSIEELFRQAKISDNDLAGWLMQHFDQPSPSDLTPKQVKEATETLERLAAAPF